MSYYERAGDRASDGTPTFATTHDEANENEVATLLQTTWNCEVHHFGRLAAIDWYATRHGRILSVLELKSRDHDTNRYHTVWLNLRKWLALMLVAQGFGVKPLFVVRFNDAVRWIDVRRVAGESLRIGGCRTRVKSISDIEPVIDVPVVAMTLLREEHE